MTELRIRRAAESDLPRLLEIYEYAKEFMRKTGNPTQWAEGGPTEGKLRDDIKNDELYVIEDSDEEFAGEVSAGSRIHAGFMLRIGDDPTYKIIYGGSWISYEPYGVIHRIAGDGTIHGVLDMAVGFAEERISHIRIDTHEDNKIMQGAILKCGFIKCGIIHLENGDERLAYEKVSRTV